MKQENVPRGNESLSALISRRDSKEEIEGERIRERLVMKRVKFELMTPCG